MARHAVTWWRRGQSRRPPRRQPISKRSSWHVTTCRITSSRSSGAAMLVAVSFLEHGGSSMGLGGIFFGFWKVQRSCADSLEPSIGILERYWQEEERVSVDATEFFLNRSCFWILLLDSTRNKIAVNQIDCKLPVLIFLCFFFCWFIDLFFFFIYLSLACVLFFIYWEIF